MVLIREDEVQDIISRVRRRLEGGVGESPTVAVRQVTTACEGAADGIYPTVDGAVEAAWAAFLRYREMGLKTRQVIVEAVRRTMRERASELAHMAHRETGIGKLHVHEEAPR